MCFFPFRPEMKSGYSLSARISALISLKYEQNTHQLKRAFKVDYDLYSHIFYFFSIPIQLAHWFVCLIVFFSFSACECEWVYLCWRQSVSVWQQVRNSGIILIVHMFVNWRFIIWRFIRVQPTVTTTTTTEKMDIFTVFTSFTLFVFKTFDCLFGFWNSLLIIME